MYCQHCGAEVSEGANFCTSCGVKIESAGNGAAAGDAAQAAAATQAATMPMPARVPAPGEDSATSGPRSTSSWDYAEQPVGEPAQQSAISQAYQQPQGGYSQQAYQGAATQQHMETVYAHSQQTETLALIAFVLALVSTISIGWLLIPLAWMIPMTVRIWGIYKGKKPNTTAFGVCTLLFLNLVGGILLLVADKDA